ncbi:MAG: DUF4336 domain-containing protein [Anaerolineaceae bacterium]|nr:DUF4336 domain-containing protein [Anaerolineaceae bacterium]
MFSDTVQLYEPINVYKPLADSIGIVDGPLVNMMYPGIRFLKIPFPTRMTVVKLSTGDIWLHSPIAYDATLALTISAMGPIRHIVSPNKLHYAHIKEWKDAFPDATAWASPGVCDRARIQRIPVTFDGELSKDAPADWSNSLNQTVIRGSFMDEVVFFHAASKTLILADGIENFELNKIKQPYRFFVWAAGAYYPCGQMPIDLRSTFWSKKRAVRATVAEMISWQPERIIVSHGRCIEKDAIGALRFAFRWAL